MGLMEAILGRRRASAAKRVGIFMLVAIATGVALTVGGAGGRNQVLLWVGVGLIVLGVLPLFGLGDLINTLVFGAIRARGRAATAAGLAMRFARQDPFGIDRLGFAGLGDGSAENVAWGAVDGRPMWWFEWSRGLVGREGSFACVLMDVGADCPPLTLARRGEGFGSDMREMTLEAAEFNRAFEVRGADRQFATAFCDARLMAWLIDAWPPGFQIEARGRHVLVWAPDLRRFPGVGTTLHFVMQMLGRGTGSPERVLAYARELNRRLPGLLGSVWPATTDPLVAQSG